MQKGDIIKIIEKQPHRKSANQIKIIIGTVISIDKYTITISQKSKNTEETYNTSYCIGDFKDNLKTFFVKSNEGWKKLSVAIKGGNENEDSRTNIRCCYKKRTKKNTAICRRKKA